MNRFDVCSCDGTGGLESRRNLLTTGLALGLPFLLSKIAFPQSTFRPEIKDGPVFVSIFLRGGADGLNIVAPYAEDRYHSARPTLGLKRPGDRVASVSDRALDLDGFFGLHPSMAGLHGLFHDGKLAVVHAVGSGDETRSHFEAMGTMERGLFQSAHGTSNGWLTRYLAQHPDRVAPLRAVALSQTLPDSLGGSLGAVAVNELDDFKLKGAPDNVLAVLEGLHTQADMMSGAGSKTIEVLKNLQRSDPKRYRPDHGAVYPESPLGRALRDVAYLVKQDFGLEVACLESLGWDTHVAQGAATGWQSGLLRDLSESLSAFFLDLGAESSRVVATVQTEFGRRLEENSGFGTDHGHGGMMMVAGGKVQGGRVFGRWPGLSQEQLVGPGDLAVTTDYRCVLAEVLEDHLGSRSTADVFPQAARDRLNLFAPASP